MGILLVVIAAALRSFASRHGWVITWWKWVLIVLWYALFGVSFYTYGTLVGENEAQAGLRLFLLGMFLSLVFGVGLRRLLAHRPKTSR